MSTDIKLTSLLCKGYFPKELPPVFTTHDFGTHSLSIIEEWRTNKLFKTLTVQRKIGGRKCQMRGCYTYDLPNAEIEIISKPKKGFERRNIHITHPLPQALLAFEMSKHWGSIQKWLMRQTYSLDEIHISSQYERSIKGIDFALHRAKKEFLEATTDWLVKTDITRFYPSIYTHSITWAAYGKIRVKKNVNIYKGSLADRLDILVRNCNRNQTVGIPIGPETSRILAEIISARIDLDFQEKNGDISANSVDRLQDDWLVGVESLEKAEHILSTISATYHAYGLEINGSKTSIRHVLAVPDPSWISELGAFLSHTPVPPRGNCLREFLSLSLRLQSQNPSESVINYVLTIIESTDIGENDIETVESFLLKSAVLSPLSMDSICRVIINIHYRTQKLSVRRIRDRFITLAERNLEKGHIYEVIWLVYAIRGLKQSINSKRFADMIEDVHGSALPLVLLDMKSRGCFLHPLPKDQWESQINDERVKSDWIWLLAYEGIRRGWLLDKKKVLEKPLFKAMHSRNVVFYDPARNVKKSERIIAAKRQMRKIQTKRIREFILKSRGFNLVPPPDVY